MATPQEARKVLNLQVQPVPDERDIELDSLAKIVLDEYPRALQDTDLFIDVLNQFGIANDQQVRSRVLELPRPT